jgi:hypothetical protein
LSPAVGSCKLSTRTWGPLLVATALGLVVGCGDCGDQDNQVARPMAVIPPTALSIHPRVIHLSVGGTTALSVRVSPNGASPAVLWKVVTPNGGSIDNQGLYQAPGTPGRYEVQAHSQAAPPVQGQVAIMVHPRPSAQVLRADRPRVAPGAPVALEPVFANGKGVIEPGSIRVDSGQRCIVHPLATTVYTLTVTNEAGLSVRAQVQVQVSEDVPLLPAPSSAPANCGQADSGAVPAPALPPAAGTLEAGAPAAIPLRRASIPVQNLQTRPSAAPQPESPQASTPIPGGSSDPVPAPPSPRPALVTQAATSAANGSPAPAPLEAQAGDEPPPAPPLGEHERIPGLAPPPGGQEQAQREQLPAGDGTQVPGQARFRRPMGAAVSLHEIVYVADGHAVLLRLPDGAVQVLAGSMTEPGYLDAEGLQARFQDPEGLGRDRDGHLFVLEPQARRVRMINTDQRVSTVYETPAQVPAERRPHCLAVVPGESRTFFLGTPGEDAGSTRIIHRVVTREGHHDEQVAAVQHLAALAADRNGNLLVLAGHPDRPVLTLQRFARGPEPDAAWAAVDRALDIGPGAGGIGPELGRPGIRAMAVDSRGSLFLADESNGVIWKVPQDLGRIDAVTGTQSWVAGMAPAEPRDPRQLLGRPRGLAVTAQDHLVYTFDEAVAKVSEPGTPDSPWHPPLPSSAAAAPGPRHRPTRSWRTLENRAIQPNVQERRNQLRGDDDEMPSAPLPLGGEDGQATAPPLPDPAPAPAAPTGQALDRGALFGAITNYNRSTLRRVRRPEPPPQEPPAPARVVPEDWETS